MRRCRAVEPLLDAIGDLTNLGDGGSPRSPRHLAHEEAAARVIADTDRLSQRCEMSQVGRHACEIERRHRGAAHLVAEPGFCRQESLGRLPFDAATDGDAVLGQPVVQQALASAVQLLRPPAPSRSRLARASIARAMRSPSGTALAVMPSQAMRAPPGAARCAGARPSNGAPSSAACFPAWIASPWRRRSS